jgi:hypothetical protein
VIGAVGFGELGFLRGGGGADDIGAEVFAELPESVQAAVFETSEIGWKWR